MVTAGSTSATKFGGDPYGFFPPARAVLFIEHLPPPRPRLDVLVRCRLPPLRKYVQSPAWRAATGARKAHAADARVVSVPPLPRGIPLLRGPGWSRGVGNHPPCRTRSGQSATPSGLAQPALASGIGPPGSPAINVRKSGPRSSQPWSLRRSGSGPRLCRRSLPRGRGGLSHRQLRNLRY